MHQFQTHSPIQSEVARLVREALRRMPGERVAPSRHTDVVERANLEWVERFALVSGAGALEKVRRIACGSFAAHTYPSASPELLLIGANLISWLYLFDDRYGEDAISAEPFQSLLVLIRSDHQDPLTECTPFHHALADLRRRIDKHVEKDFFERFANSLNTYFTGCRIEVPYRSSGLSPSLEEYRTIRHWSVGGLPVFDLVELAIEGTLPSDTMSKSDRVDLRRLAALLCGWVNDIFSFEKERRDGDPLNLVAVLRHEGDLDTEEGFMAAADVYCGDLEAFERIARRVVESDRSSVAERAYIEGLRAWIHGNRAWTGTSQRYQHLAVPPATPSQLGSRRFEQRILTVPAAPPSHN